MEVALILAKQLATMFIFMVVGFILFKLGMLTKNGTKELGSMLLYAIMPCMILKSFYTSYTPERLKGLLLGFALSTAALLLAIAVGELLFKKRSVIDAFASGYSNAGYMGIPLVSAVLGSEAVFYVASFVAMLNVLQWTHGAVLMTGRKDCVQPKKILTNPVILSVILGFLLFLLPVELPSIAYNALDSMSALNGPVAMIILGSYLAQTKLSTIFTDKSLYPSALFARLLLIPLLTIAGLSLVPAEFSIVRLTVLIVASAPVGTNIGIFAQQYGQDYTRAVRVVCLSTLLSVVTMPLIIALANLLWGAV